MQESLFNTVLKKTQTEQKINVEELEIILNSDIEEVVGLCKKACLKPKTDNKGNAYFTFEEVNMLKKMKELYSKSTPAPASGAAETVQKSTIEEAPREELNLTKKVNFLKKAKDRFKTEGTAPIATYSTSTVQIQHSIQKLEKNLIDKMGELLSEKMDGFDEIIVELIRSKTENENLRGQVNSLNKQLFALKNELASYQPLALGLYVKKDID